MDYREKIKKLLALAESPNESEAKAALLKARELMAEHKLSEAECQETLKKKVIRFRTAYNCTKRVNPWMIGLIGVIAESYRCQPMTSRASHSKTYTVGFIGFEDDVALCNEMFAYAVKCIEDRNKKMAEDYRVLGAPADFIRAKKNSYGYGFTIGLQEAIELQNRSKKQEWGLVLQTPQEVIEEVSTMSKSQFRSKSENEISSVDYMDGHEDGKRFTTKSVLRGESA